MIPLASNEYTVNVVRRHPICLDGIARDSLGYTIFGDDNCWWLYVYQPVNGRFDFLESYFKNKIVLYKKGKTKKHVNKETAIGIVRTLIAELPV